MILVTGATGNVGGAVLTALAAEGAPVRALVRRDEDRERLPVGVDAVPGDLDRPVTLRDALAGVRGVFLLPGYADMVGLLAQARRAGVDRIVLLSGASAASGDLSNAISRYMIRSEQAVHSCGLMWTIVRPHAFMSNTLRWRPQLRTGDVVRAPFADVKVSVIDPADIGTVVAAALLAHRHDGKTYRVTGPQSLLPAEQVAILAEVLDRPLRFEAQPNAEARTDMSAAMPAEYVDAFFNFYVDGALDESPVLPTVHDLTGRPPHTFEQWATTHAAEFE